MGYIIKNIKMIIKYITLYYDSYEKNFGDGFYPLTFKDKSCNESVDIGFEYINGVWAQYTENCIKGFDLGEQKKVLNLLNDSKHHSNIIVDRLGYLI